MFEKKIKITLKNNIIKIVKSIQVNPSNCDLYHEIRKKTNRKKNKENHKACFLEKTKSTRINFSNMWPESLD
jgi:hypothetical protein